MDAITYARQLIAREAAAVAAVSEVIDEGFLAVAKLLQECTGKVFVTGAGTSGTAAERMVHILSVTGTPAAFLSVGDALSGGVSAIQREDVAILISKGGKSADVNQLADLLQNRGVPTVGITSSKESPFIQRVDYPVWIDTPAEADLGDMVATSSTLCVGVWGDALAAVLMGATGYSWADFVASHPAGIVGQARSLPEPLPTIEL